MTAEELKLAAERKESLTAETEMLNTDLAAVEEQLKAMRFGVRASVPMVFEESDSSWLTWGKHDRQWRLLHTTSETEEPLVNASRAVRLKAIDFLPALVRGLLESLKTEISKVQRARGVVEAFTAELKKHDG